MLLDTSTPAVEAIGVSKTFESEGQAVEALRGVDLAIQRGEMISIMGPSGSGKSTLLHLLGALDRPSGGEVRLAGRPLGSLSRRELAQVRGRQVGFVFQQFNLLPGLTAAENVALPALIAGIPSGERERRVGELMDLIGLTGAADRRPSQMSGGQQQRIAIARALIMEPAVVLADEPTGNLDSGSGEEVMELIDRCHERGQTIVVVTHDARVAARAERIVTMGDGQVTDETVLPPKASPGSPRKSNRKRLPNLIEMGDPHLLPDPPRGPERPLARARASHRSS